MDSFGVFRSLRRADQPTNTFLNPPPLGGEGLGNSILTVGSTVPLSWRSNFTTMDLNLFQQLNKEKASDCSGCIAGPYKIAEGLTTYNYSWVVDTGPLLLSSSSVFFLQVQNLDAIDLSSTFSSGFFNITQKPLLNLTLPNTNSSTKLSRLPVFLPPDSTTTFIEGSSTSTQIPVVSTLVSETNSVSLALISPIITTALSFATMTLATTISAPSPTSSPTSTSIPPTPTSTASSPAPTSSLVSALAQSAMIAGMPKHTFTAFISISLFVLLSSVVASFYFARRNKKRRRDSELLARQSWPPHESTSNLSSPVGVFAGDKPIPELSGDFSTRERIYELEAFRRKTAMCELPIDTRRL